MAYFPMFIDIEKKKCLVAGGGTVALRKVRVLLDFGAQITVVAPQIDPQILQLTGNVCVKERTFEPEDLKECVLVVAATDDVRENHRIARMAQKKHIPVNAVDQQEDCSFIFPSYLKHRDLVGAFSSAGNSPVLTQYLKESLKEILTEELGQINDYMGSIRPVVKTRIETEKLRRQVYQTILAGCLQRKKLHCYRKNWNRFLYRKSVRKSKRKEEQGNGSNKKIKTDCCYAKYGQGKSREDRGTDLPAFCYGRGKYRTAGGIHAWHLPVFR